MAEIALSYLSKIITTVILLTIGFIGYLLIKKELRPSESLNKRFDW